MVGAFSPAGSKSATISANGLYHPNGVATDASGNVYVTDQDDNSVYVYSAGGGFITKFGTEGSGNGQFEIPAYVSVASGHVFVTDENNNRVQEFSTAGQFQATWGSGGDTPGLFTNPLGISADVAGNVYVADQGNSRIQKFYLGPSPCSGVNAAHTKACGEEQATCLAQLVPTKEVTCMSKVTAKYARFRKR